MSPTNSGTWKPRAKTRDQLLSSILHPTKAIMPGYQGWYIKLLDGSTYHGRQIDIGEREIERYAHSGGFKNFIRKE